MTILQSDLEWELGRRIRAESSDVYRKALKDILELVENWPEKVMPPL